MVYGSNGIISNVTVTSTYPIRPSISLIPNIEINNGDGTINNPYMVED